MDTIQLLCWVDNRTWTSFAIFISIDCLLTDWLTNKSKNITRSLKYSKWMKKKTLKAKSQKTNNRERKIFGVAIQMRFMHTCKWLHPYAYKMLQNVLRLFVCLFISLQYSVCWFLFFAFESFSFWASFVFECSRNMFDVERIFGNAKRRSYISQWNRVLNSLAKVKLSPEHSDRRLLM